MGTLVEQPISTLFQGVSRQPDTVRLPGQVEEGENTSFSVVTGGFSERAGSLHVAELTSLGAPTNIAAHFYERDESEKYAIVIKDDGTLYVYDILTGAEKVVNHGSTYGPDTTLGETATALSSTSPSTPTQAIDDDPLTGWSSAGADVQWWQVQYGASKVIRRLTMTNLSNASYSRAPRAFTLLASNTGAFGGEEDTLLTVSQTGAYWSPGETKSWSFVNLTPYTYYRIHMTDKQDSFGKAAEYIIAEIELKETLDETPYLNTPIGMTPSEAFRFHTIADFTFIANRGVEIAMLPTVGGTITGTVQTFSDLPGSPTLGQIYRVTGNDTDAFTGFLVEWNGSVWEETADPTIPNSFDPTTMPHELVRLDNGEFEIRPTEWASREVGDDILVPDPDFVGQRAQDIVFYRDRYGIMADEVIYFSRAGDFFNMWPRKATDQLDDDPLGRQSYGKEINILNFAVPFRRALFLTSDKAQFEVSSDGPFTPRTAVLDATTGYKAEERCRPLLLGDTLYFAAHAEKDAKILEYLLEDNSLTNTASDPSKHVEGYLPAPLVKMFGDTTTSTLGLLSSSDREALYIYKSFFEDDSKVQSAWARWEFGGNIHYAEFINDAVYFIVTRDTSTFLEKVRVTDEWGMDTEFNIQNSEGTRWPLRLDRRVSITGVYNGGSDETDFDLGFDPGEDIVVVEGNDFADPGKTHDVSDPGGATFSLPGDLTDGEVLVGVPYTMRVRLSKQYLRDANQRAVTSGRLTLKKIGFNYERTGYFRVEVTPKSRAMRSKVMTGRILGQPTSVIGDTPILEDGTFETKVGSKADTVVIEVVNDTHIPCTITSAYWVGFFNETTRQERA